MATFRAVTRPILPSADLEETARFYALLGFDERGRWPGEYLIVADSHGIELHFWCKPDVSRWTNDVACWIGLPTPADVHALYESWAATDLPAPADLRPPRQAGHLLELDLIDLHGNLLRVGTPTQPRTGQVG
ncbi:hypothetical protein [Mumia sp. Pv 4-285]|uniref:hypothetical protein n=1 Tax=Mumia qirimensis TaxID=3234852 RepID=UPI00351DA51F